MRCHYCFQPLPDRTSRCPACGSRQPVETERAAGDSRSQRAQTPISRKTLFRTIILLVLVFSCVTVVLTVMIRPGLLPAPIVAALNLGTPLPTSTPQVTRAAIATPTPLAWTTHVNGTVGFEIEFPAGWLVIDRSESRWRIDARRLALDYPWALDLFEVYGTQNWEQSRAVDPAALNEQTGQIVVFDAGPVSELVAGSTLDEIEQLARETPAVLVELAGRLVSDSISAQRTQRLLINGREALLVEFSSQTVPWGDVDAVVPIRIRQYYVQGPDGLYLVSYFCGEELATRNRALYDRVVQSFQIEG
jgi:hypothetical protein